MRINISICIFLPKNYKFLLLYHVNSPLQVNFNFTNICSNIGFPNLDISLHSLLDIPVWSQCNHILYLLSNHPNLYTSFFHNTSNATCTIP